jgi:penicillin-binding protein 1C
MIASIRGALVPGNKAGVGSVWRIMRARGSRRWLRRHRRLVIGAAGLPALTTVVVLGLLTFAYFAPFDEPEARMQAPGAVVVDSTGVILQRDTSDGIRIPVTLDAIAPYAIEATIGAEDERFFRHPGADPIAMVRAAVHLPRARSGASTITQQLARRLYLPGDSPLFVRKVRESLVAFQLEAHLSKDEILEAYLNSIYYGRGAYGIEAAARVYFGTSARNLDLAQASFLAGLPQLPGALDPTRDAAPGKARQAYVLDRMVARGKISRAEAEAAAREPLEFLAELQPPIAPHFVQFALAELAAVRPDLAGRPGLVIETTLDAGLHQEAERAARLRLAELDGRGAHNAAVVVLDPASGRLLAMVGNLDFFGAGDGSQLNMALEPRQPGSALKPFLYLAAFENGYTAATPVLDVPTVFATATGPYAPQNYDRRFHGVVAVREALASSLNVPAVRTLDEIGVGTFLEVAHRVGLRTLTDTEVYGLALTLGGGEVRLLDLATAYGSLANRGLLVEPYAVQRVRDHTGEVLYERPPARTRRVASPQHAYLLADILADRDARITGFGQATPFDLPFRAAVKTGTTSAWRDNWTLGFTADRVVGVWVGNADNRPMEGVSGIDGTGPIWRDVMLMAARGRQPQWLERPPGLVEATVCPPTGLLPGAACPSPARELFVAGTEPRAVERYYLTGQAGEPLVDPPPAARAWAIDAGMSLAPASTRPVELQIAQPGPGWVVYLAPELPDQRLLIRLSVPPGTSSLVVKVDGEAAGRPHPADPRLVWRLEPGHHVLEATAVLADGRVLTATTRFEVREP